MTFDLLYMTATTILYSMNTFSNKDKAKKIQDLSDYSDGERHELGSAEQIIRIYTPIILIQLLFLGLFKYSPKRNK